MQIQISETTNHYLINVIRGFVTELRGEIIIKVLKNFSFFSFKMQHF